MYANAYHRTSGVYRRRRTRRSPLRRLGPLALLLITILTAIRLIPYLQTGSRDQVAEVAPSTGAQAPTFRLDTAAPEISGVRDITVYAGEPVAYRQGVTVTDDSGEAIALEIDSSAVNLDIPGSYTVTYSAADASGNLAAVQARVIVLARPGLAASGEATAAAQELLDQILTPAMSTRQQVEAIYHWIHANFSYGGHSDRTDWRQTGLDMLSGRYGDCYGYFSASKLLFETLGIPNIDVQKVRNSPNDSDHFWSLVSVDGGVSYYHFDCTPRVGQVESFCLITDAALDSYSRENKNSHNRDRSLYPDTPEAGL